MKKSKGRNYKNKKTSTAKRRRNKQILPALAAVGGACGLASAPATALELGDIRVDSHLGQPLRASIAYALAPNEDLYSFCIFLNPGLSANGIPSVSNAQVTVTNNAIILNGRTRIREPLLAMRVSVDCAYAARMARDYTLMIDPAPRLSGEPVALSEGLAIQAPLPGSTAAATDEPVTQRPAPVARRTARPENLTPVSPSTRYLVQQGDTLSEIVTRIENRSISIWPAVDAIFAANPHAFIDNDPNLLKAGSWLDIPDLSGTAINTAADSGGAVTPAPANADAGTSVSYTGIADTEAASEPAPAAEAEPMAEPAAEPVLVAEPVEETIFVDEPAAESVAEVQEPQLRPGDFASETDNPFVVPLDSSDGVIDIPDSEMDGPRALQPVPAVAVRPAEDSGTSSAWTWLFWLGGAGVALILGLLFFGRQIRDRFGSVAVGAPAEPQRRHEDEQPTARMSATNIEFNFDADSLTSTNMSLDPNAEADTGLDDSAEMEMAQDFGYSATATDAPIDIELTEHAAPEEQHEAADDTAPQPELDDSTEPLEAVSQSEDDEEDYDFSMNIDATKQILQEDASTAKDLQAVMLDKDDGETDITGDYTVSKEVEYQILEQDYEEEMSATQVLDTEVQAAARALAEQVGDETGEIATDTGETKALTTPKDPDLSAELTANLEPSGDAENEEFNEDSIPDLMVEMPGASDDETMEAEVPVIDLEKKEAS